MKKTLIGIALILLLSTTAVSAGEIVVIDLIAAGQGVPNASGFAIIFGDRDGDDRAIFSVSGLAPKNTFTLMMAQSPAPNTLPAYLLTEFTTGSDGTARFDVEAELINAYIGVNPSREDENGIAGVPGAGSIANGARTISMDFFRIYNAQGAANVFGRSADEPSGAIVLTSERIPDEDEL